MFYISGIKVQNSLPQQGSMINFQGSSNVTVENISLDNISSAFATFTDIQGIKMAGLSLSKLKQPLKFVRSEVEVIKDSQFLNNSFDGSGGAISMLNSNFMIKNTSFTYNNATKGGAISFECTSMSVCKLLIEGSNFTSNSASIQGGAISYNYNHPEVASSNFTNNSAPYGHDYGSYPARIGYINSKASDEITISEIGSGVTITNIFELALIDIDNQVMTLDNENQILLLPQDSSKSAISGINVLKVSQGVATFDSVAFEVNRGLNTSNFSIRSKAIDSTKVSQVLGISFKQKDLTVNFRD